MMKGDISTMSYIIAVPSENPGGMDAAVGAHFGHCDCYTLVQLDKGQVADIRVIANVAHQQGGCMAPVKHLAENGVNQLISSGMGMRPLMGFNQMGINVFYGDGTRTVGEAVKALLGGKLKRFHHENTCSGCNEH